MFHLIGTSYYCKRLVAAAVSRSVHLLTIQFCSLLAQGKRMYQHEPSLWQSATGFLPSATDLLSTEMPDV